MTANDSNHGNGGRERILERIRAGLRAPQRAPHPAPNEPQADSAIFAPITNPLARFLAEAEVNSIECSLTDHEAGSAGKLAEVLASLPEGEIFAQDDPWLRRLLEISGSSRPARWSSQGAPREISQATITLADSLIAQTGSIFVTAACGGRGASIVAPCHIVVATRDQLVADLQTALSSASRRGILDQKSFACVISGSSRTADIEKILVQGAHGPRRVVLILQGQVGRVEDSMGLVQNHQ